jgi:hypothetical protein
MCKLFHGGNVDLEALGVVKALYTDSSSRVKWGGEVGDSFPVLQGVRQGGILSPRLYKEYINGLLEQLEYEGEGMFIGASYVGSPTVADDVMLLAKAPTNLQVMINTVDRYSKRERYNIHPQKSAIIQISSSMQLSSFQWQLGSEEVGLSKSATHLGIDTKGAQSREHCHTEWIQDKLKSARRTVYGLIGTGLHGVNGLDPQTGIRIYNLYVLPKLLYGLDVIDTNKTQRKKLEHFHLAMLRAIQSLPDRTATEAVYLLSGTLPMEALIHLRKLSLIGAIARSENATMCDIAVRQCAMTGIPSASWFNDTEILLIKYGLPLTVSLIQYPIPKERWKKLVRDAVNQFWTQKLRREAEEDKPSLALLNLQHVSIGKVHHCWRFLVSCVKDVRRATIRAKFLTGSYPTQERLARYSEGKVTSLFSVCKTAEEDVVHLLLHCPATFDFRRTELSNIAGVVSNLVDADTWSCIASQDGLLVRLIMDPTFLMDDGSLPVDEELLETLEWHARRLCYSVHCGRAHLLETMKAATTGK